MIIQPIVNIAEICSQHSINQVVISPGSRSAPVTLAFVRHPNMHTFIIPDERSAGFVALGLAQSGNKPVVLVCTSGTAVANIYPAIIEAYYQQVPLIVITADRPPEWIDQQDGQTIRQQNIFQNHIRGFYQFPVSFDHEEAKWHGEKMISEAILKSTGTSKGPVHINIPIREPFYPSPEEEFHYSKHVQAIVSTQIKQRPNDTWSLELIKSLKKFSRIMVLAGQTRIPQELRASLNYIQKKMKWVMIGDITSNLDCLEHSITKHDIILKDHADTNNLIPDLLISFGQSVLSKTLKIFLRNERPQKHWHIGTGAETIDPFKSLTNIIKLEPEDFFNSVKNNLSDLNKTQNSFYNHWIEKEIRARAFITDYLEKRKNSELHAAGTVISNLPSGCHLHLANSMPVRYANLLGLTKNQGITVWSNRGTSGIDGCLSTSVGHTLNTDQLNVLLSGDMAFFYDRNGLWHNHKLNNLRIIILNNHGGGIFRMIDGPKQLDELEEYFETNQKLNAVNTARDFGMNYINIKNIEVLADALPKFFDKKSGPSILEIETNPKMNQSVYEDFKHKSTVLWEQ